MRYSIEGKTFVCVGFQAHILPGLTQQLEEQGGEIVATLSANVDYLVVGPSSSANAYGKAVSLGVIVLSPQQLLNMLNGQDVHAPQTSTTSLDELFGFVRAMLQEAHVDEDLWYGLLKKLDRCDEDRLAALTAYIDDHTGRWNEALMHGHVGHVIFPKELKKDHLAHKLTEHRDEGGVPGELRVAPLRWFAEMAKGHSSPKYRIIRAIDLKTTTLAASAQLKMITLPELSQVHTLVMNARRAPTKGLIKALWAGDSLSDLKRLHVIKLKPAHVEQLAWESEPRKLEALDLHEFDVGGFKHTTRELAALLMSAPLFATIRSLCMPPAWGSSPVTDYLEHAHHCPDLDTYELPLDGVGNSESFESFLTGGLFARLTTLRVRPWRMRTTHQHKESWQRDFNRHISATVWRGFCHVRMHEHVHTLDLSGVSWDAESPFEQLLNLYLRPLCEGRILTHVRHLLLGHVAEHPDAQRSLEAWAPSHIKIHAWAVPDESRVTLK